MLESFSDRIKPTFVDIILPLEQSEDSKAQKAAVAAKLNTKISQIVELRLRKHSIDARQRKIKVQAAVQIPDGVTRRKLRSHRRLWPSGAVCRFTLFGAWAKANDP